MLPMNSVVEIGTPSKTVKDAVCRLMESSMRWPTGGDDLGEISAGAGRSLARTHVESVFTAGHEIYRRVLLDP